ncbi:MAG: oxidase [Firmicutes bacterium]|nr:oxidase [Bacillota bacterium]
MKTLFDETQLHNIKLKNRMIRSATWERMADKTGHLTDKLLKVYEDLANGGIGLIITSVAYITNDCQDLLGRLGIYDDSFIEDYKQLTKIAHDSKCPIILQLAYAGKDGEGYLPSSPTKEDIKSIVVAFGKSALRAKHAGFDGVQIHAAHGFFLSQFIHPSKNTRQDEYGGSLKNRTRILLEIYDEIRLQTGNDFNIFIKIDSTDLAETNDCFTSCEYACIQLANRGINAIEISGEKGAIVPSIRKNYPESIFKDYAAKIAEKVQIPVILVGLNRTPSIMKEILNTSTIEYFSLARPLLREPDLPNQWRKNPDKSAACISCNKCFRPQGNSCIFL